MGNSNSSFNWEQYVINYPDLAAAGINTPEKAVTHFINHGQAEGRVCIPINFDYRQYLTNYPDLLPAGILTQEKALTHYINHGRSEGRTDKLYVSIGSNCSVAFILNKIHSTFFNNKPTNLFDYLITTKYPYLPVDGLSTIQLSLKNVNEILKDNYKFNVEDLRICKDLKWINNFNSKHQPVFHKHFISIHDQPVGNDDLNELNNKLNRRLQRFKDIIKSNKTITFIRYELYSFDINNYIEFKNIISRINPELNIKIYIISDVVITDPNLEYLKIFKLKDYTTKNKSDNLWPWSNFDWELFFRLI